MRERIRPARTDDSSADSPERRPSFLEQVAEFVRDEAIGHVVDKASGGWLSYEGNDDEEDAPRRDPRTPADSFNDRIERALAELRAQEQAAPVSQQVPVPEPQRTPINSPVSASAPVGARTFGRKAV